MLKIISELNADAIGKFLREKQMSLLVKNGGMCLVPLQGMQEHRMLVFTAAILRNPRSNEPPLSDEKNASFYAALAAKLNVRCPFLGRELITNDRKQRESQSHPSTPY